MPVRANTKRKVFARGPSRKNNPHNAPPDSSRFAKNPPALYHTASICSRGFCGGEVFVCELQEGIGSILSGESWSGFVGKNVVYCDLNSGF